MKRFAIAFMNYSDNDLQVVVIEGTDWKYAVMAHPNYPYRKQQLPPGEDDNSFIPISELIAHYPNLSEEEAVKQCCFDCDCLMGWVELEGLTADSTTLQ